jgi:hypothetical protein
LAINSRLIKVSPSRFPPWVSSSVSNDSNLEVKAAPRPPDLLGTDEAEGRISGETLRVVHVLIASQTAVDRLAQQISQRQMDVLSPTGIGQVPFDEVTQTQTLVQLAHQ